MSRYGIRLRNVIGHNESLTSPYHRDATALALPDARRLDARGHADLPGGAGSSRAPVRRDARASRASRRLGLLGGREEGERAQARLALSGCAHRRQRLVLDELVIRPEALLRTTSPSRTAANVPSRTSSLRNFSSA